MPILLTERPALSVGDVELVAVNFTDHLNVGEIIDSMSVEELESDDLTITNLIINPDSYIEFETEQVVEPFHAACFMLTCLVTGIYKLRVTVDTLPQTTTNYTPISRQFVRDIWIQFI